MKIKFCVIFISIAALLIFNGNLNAFTIFQRVGIASSPNPVGSGARAMGMGGGFIAVADDATAASWNPAGLIQLERPELSVVGAYVSRTDDFSSSSNPEINNKAKIDDTNINYFSASYPFDFLNKNMVVSLNYQRLYEFKRKLDYHLDITSPPPLPPISSSQDRRYNQDGYIGALGLAYSAEITPRISVGLTFNIWTDKLGWRNGWKETYSNHTVTTFGALTTIEDTLLTDDYSEFRGVNINLGVLWNVNQYLTIGAVLKTPFTAEFHHKFTENWTQRDENGVITNSLYVADSEKNELDMPMSYGIGFAWRFSDQFTIDLDVYRTEWSEYILTDGQGNEFSPVDGRPKSESDIEDTTQIRFGGEYLFIDPDRNMVVPIRAGIFYDPEPSQGKVKDFFGITLGSGIGYKRFIFDLAYQLRWGNNVDTENLIANSEADVIQHTILASLIVHL
jgi:long-subunit fatty acid transport protein